MDLDLRFDNPVWLLLALVLALGAATLEWRASRSRRRAWWRAALVLGTGLALAGPRLPGGGAPRGFVLVDASASVAPLSRSLALETMAGPEPFLRLDFGGPAASPIGDAMARLLDLARAGDRVFLLSDGLWTSASGEGRSQGAWEPSAAAAALRQRGAGVDVIALEARATTGLALWSADAVPRGGRVGDLVPLRLRAASDQPRRARLRLTVGKELLAARELDLRAGQQDIDLALGGLGAGAWALEARLAADGLEEARVDLGLTVAPVPRILVAGAGGLPTELGRGLAAAGLDTQPVGFADLPSRVSAYRAWEAVVLLDPNRGDLGFDQLQALEAQVAAGGGLLLVGGPNSFDAGDWQGSALERLSPLSLQTPPRRERPPVALSFLIDRSASMGSVEGRGRLAKIDLARDAVLLAAQSLAPGDRLGLLAFDAEAAWLLEPAVLGAGRERAELEGALATFGTAGGTNIGGALDLALPALLPDIDRPPSHAILVTDGQDFASDRQRMLAQARSLRDSGASLSTIALGADADRGLLADLAAAGGGRFHLASEPSDLPRLVLSESRIVSTGAEQRGSFRAVPPPTRWPAALAGVDVAQLPPLQAYRALMAKEGLQPILQVADGDPLLLAWPRGQGQVAAFSSSLAPDWTAGWLLSEPALKLMASTLRQLARAPEATTPQVRLRGSQEAAALVVTGLDAAAQVETRIHLEGVEAALPSQPAGPGALVAPLPGPAQRVWAGQLRREGSPPLPFVVAATDPREALPGQSADQDLLARVAAAGGGRILTAEEAARTLPRGASTRGWPWGQRLLGLIALLWLIDLAQLMAPERWRLLHPFTQRRDKRGQA